MHFLPDVYVTCDVCKGKRYNRETLEITFKDKSIADVLDMTVEEGAKFFSAVPSIRDKLETLARVGLGYIHIGQQATTLSGGEAQRIKLSKELSRRATGRTLYILDEPTTGLHFHDVAKLLEVLHELADAGNTVVVIEHNLEVIKTADWVIDMGPQGGDGGGRIIAAGTPEDVAATKESYTGQYLRDLLGRRAGGAQASSAKSRKRQERGVATLSACTPSRLRRTISEAQMTRADEYAGQSPRLASRSSTTITRHTCRLVMPRSYDARRWSGDLAAASKLGRVYERCRCRCGVHWRVRRTGLFASLLKAIIGISATHGSCARSRGHHQWSRELRPTRPEQQAMPRPGITRSLMCATSNAPISSSSRGVAALVISTVHVATCG